MPALPPSMAVLDGGQHLPGQASISHQGASCWPLQTPSPLMPTVSDPALADWELALQNSSPPSRLQPHAE